MARICPIVNQMWLLPFKTCSDGRSNEGVCRKHMRLTQMSAENQKNS